MVPVRVYNPRNDSSYTVNVSAEFAIFNGNGAGYPDYFLKATTNQRTRSGALVLDEIDDGSYVSGETNGKGITERVHDLVFGIMTQVYEDDSSSSSSSSSSDYIIAGWHVCVLYQGTHVPVEIRINGYENPENDTSIVVPRAFRLGGYWLPVTKLNDRCFAGYDINKINAQANGGTGAGFENVTEIFVPSTVEKIGWNVFAGCDALTDLHMRPLSIPAIEVFVASGDPWGAVGSTLWNGDPWVPAWEKDTATINLHYCDDAGAADYQADALWGTAGYNFDTYVPNSDDCRCADTSSSSSQSTDD